MADRPQTALGVARARFLESLPNKARELRASVAVLAGTPDEDRPRDELRRRLHALFASAQVFRLDALTDVLRTSLRTLDAARDERRSFTQDELDSFAGIARELPALAVPADGSSKPTGPRVPRPDALRRAASARTSAGPAVAPSLAPGLTPPVAAASRPAPPRHSFLPPEPAPEPTAERVVEVLVADAEPALADARATLPPGRYEVIGGLDVDAVLAMARSGDLDVILVGDSLVAEYDLVARLREDPLVGPAPVVLLVPSGTSFDTGAARALGAAAVLEKPLDPEKTLRTLAQVLREGPKSERPPALDAPNLDELADRLTRDMNAGFQPEGADDDEPSLRRLRSRLRATPEVRGRLEHLGLRRLLETVSELRPNARVEVSGGGTSVELDLRGGELLAATRTTEDGAFTRGPRALDSAVAAASGRFVVVEGSGPVRRSLSGPIGSLLDESEASLAARREAVRGDALRQAETITFDEDLLPSIEPQLEPGQREILRRLKQHTEPPRTLDRSGMGLTELEEALDALARKAGITEVRGAHGEDLVAVARRSLAPPAGDIEPRAPLGGLEEWTGVARVSAENSEGELPFLALRSSSPGSLATPGAWNPIAPETPSLAVEPLALGDVPGPELAPPAPPPREPEGRDGTADAFGLGPPIGLRELAAGAGTNFGLGDGTSSGLGDAGLSPGSPLGLNPTATAESDGGLRLLGLGGDAPSPPPAWTNLGDLGFGAEPDAKLGEAPGLGIFASEGVPKPVGYEAWAEAPLGLADVPSSMESGARGGGNSGGRSSPSAPSEGAGYLSLAAAGAGAVGAAAVGLAAVGMAAFRTGSSRAEADTAGIDGLRDFTPLPLPPPTDSRDEHTEDRALSTFDASPAAERHTSNGLVSPAADSTGTTSGFAPSPSDSAGTASDFAAPPASASDPTSGFGALPASASDTIKEELLELPFLEVAPEPPPAPPPEAQTLTPSDPAVLDPVETPSADPVDASPPAHGQAPAVADEGTPVEQPEAAPTRAPRGPSAMLLWVAWGLTMAVVAATGAIAAHYFLAGEDSPRRGPVPPSEPRAAAQPAPSEPESEEPPPATPPAGETAPPIDPTSDDGVAPAGAPVPALHAYGREVPGIASVGGVTASETQGLLVVEPSARPTQGAGAQEGASVEVGSTRLDLGGEPSAVALSPGVHHVTFTRGDRRDFVWVAVRAGHTRFVPTPP